MATLSFNGQHGFDAQQVDPQQAFENLPNGWYLAKIVESEMKPASTQGNSYLEIVHEVIAPQQFAGRKLWNRLNLVNHNEIAVRIAYETLSAICHATGQIQIQDSQQLHEIPLEVKVGLSKVTADYPDARNEIKGYRAVQGTGQAPAQQPVQQPNWANQEPVQQAPAQQPVQQPNWANQEPVQQAPAQQPVQQVPAQQPVQQQIETAQQPATDPQAQAAAAVSKAPWEQ